MAQPNHPSLRPSPAETKAFSAPQTRAEPLVEDLFGVAVADPFRWLEDQEAPEVRAWIQTQNEFTEAHTHALPQRQQLVEAYRALANEDSYSLPIRRGERYLFTRKLKGQDLELLCLREGQAGTERVLIDPHDLSPDHSISVSILDFSPDGQKVIYQLRKNGEDQVEVRILDLEKNCDLPDALPHGLYNSVQFSKDNLGFFYVARPEAGPRLYYHRLDTSLDQDPVLFGEGLGPERYLMLLLSASGQRKLFISAEGSSGNSEIYYSASPEAETVSLIDAKVGWAMPFFLGERPCAFTNINAPHFQVLKAPSDDTPGPLTQWPTLIPEHPSAVLEDLSAVGGKLIVKYLDQVSSHLAVFTAEGNPEGKIELPGLGDVTSLSGSWDQSDGYFGFTSFFTPMTGYRYDTASGQRETWFQPQIPVDTSSLTVSQAWSTSKDGTKVPMFLIHAKDLKRNGQNPTLITGYGGFRVNLTPYFNSSAIIWAKSGGVYAVANLRGGSEFGETWHEQGKMAQKQNTFDDLYGCAQWLIQEGYTQSERLCVVGGSNGGLLVSAAITQRPELFKAAACLYPLCDMLRFHKFLMGSFWVSEYGNPEDSNDFPIIHAYSPYHHAIQGTHYPATIFVSGDADTRVAPLHARKMAALIQANQAGPAPILLQYDTKSGHSGGGSIEHSIQSTSTWMAFLLNQLGLHLAKP